ncbi:MAG TPA: c-type cytochrome biogenesis protein CcsB [Candidatus Binataceae bacterium]|nr:c-type cytochrome biogenesis protein CcsB [Candidatus Binataceae bacterium]
MSTLWLAPALVLYVLAVFLFVSDMVQRQTRLNGYALIALGAGAISHTMDLITRGVQAGNMPVGNFAQSLSFLAWIIALASLVMIVRFKMPAIGAFTTPAVVMALGAAYVMMPNEAHRLPSTLRSAWLPIHVTLAFFGEALLMLAASVSLVYLVHDSRLKAKRSLGMIGGKLPSLEKLDRINYRLLGWGFVLLSLAMVTGAIWAANAWGRFWSWEPIECWTLLTWLLYAGLLESRLAAGWRGRRAATLTIALFTILVGSYLGVSLVYPGKHGGSFG